MLLDPKQRLKESPQAASPALQLDTTDIVAVQI
jgi:hypothetical protein